MFEMVTSSSNLGDIKLKNRIIIKLRYRDYIANSTEAKATKITSSFRVATIKQTKAGFDCIQVPRNLIWEVFLHRINCVAMSRQLFAAPRWTYKVTHQKCLTGIQSHKGVHCIYKKEEI